MLHTFVDENEAQIFFERLLNFRIGEDMENQYINGYNRAYNTDGFTRSCLFELKLDLGASYGLKQAKKQAETYSWKLKTNGEYLPKYFVAVGMNKGEVFIFDNATMDKIEKLNLYNESDKIKLFEYSQRQENIKYYVNSDTVLGLADKFYRQHTTANKIDFFDNYLKQDNDKFNKFTGDEKEFAHIMDELNDPQSQKVLGAFYTPDRYVKISTEYVKDAIKKVKEQGFEDYVIIDRVAGTGNLQKFLSPEELRHCILNTYEAKEWIALCQLYQGKVRRIIPPTYNVNGTLLQGGNALEESFFDNFQEEFKLRDEGKLAIIMLENPPYAEGRGWRDDNVDMTGLTKTYISEIMSQAKVNNGKKGLVLQKDLLNQFIWSAYAIFKPEYYILYAPVRYWKTQHLIDKQFIQGYLCNRKYFHAGEAGISLIEWGKTDEINERLVLSTEENNDIEIKKIYHYQSELRDMQSPYEFAQFNILESSFNNNIGILTDKIAHTPKGIINVTKENLLNQIPIWASTKFVLQDYTEIEVLRRSADGGTAYQNDKDFLNDCLIYSLLTNQNKCSKENVFYLYGFTQFNQKQKHDEIMKLWMNIYHKTQTYGLNNVIRDKDTFTINAKGERIYDDAELHEWILTLKEALKKFYIVYIKPKMLKYELVK